MNYSTNYVENPTQEMMRLASFNRAQYNYTTPFRPMDEEFKRISDYFPEIRDYYWISNYGHVYTANGNRYVPPQMYQGYCIYGLRRKDEYIAQGKSPTYNIAGQILVCTCFNGPKPGPKYQVNHRDFVRHNNYYRNLEWVTPRENLDYSRAAGNYWNGNVYSSATRTEEQVRQVCELMEKGILDPQTISQTVFGCDVTPALYGLYRDIRSGGWFKVTVDYNIPEIDHRDFTNDEYIHAMCRYMVDNPDSAYSASLETVLAYSGIQIRLLDTKTRHRLNSALNQLRYRGAYKRITCQYNLPPVPNL